jgi:hypothetical protein
MNRRLPNGGAVPDVAAPAALGEGMADGAATGKGDGPESQLIRSVEYAIRPPVE